MKKGIMGLGAKKADIMELQNVDFKGFSDLIASVRDKIGAYH